MVETKSCTQPKYELRKQQCYDIKSLNRFAITQSRRQGIRDVRKNFQRGAEGRKGYLLQKNVFAVGEFQR